MLQTASMALCGWVAVTATHHIIFNLLAQARARSGYMFAAILNPVILCFGSAVFRPEHLTNFGFAFPSLPLFPVKFHEARRRFDRLFFRLQLKRRIPSSTSLGQVEQP